MSRRVAFRRAGGLMVQALARSNAPLVKAAAPAWSLTAPSALRSSAFVGSNMLPASAAALLTTQVR